MLGVPKATADLRRIKLKTLLKKGQCVKIPSMKMINFYLKFESGELKEISVKKGAKLLDLPSVYLFDEGVDIDKFNKKRFLKEGEVVVVRVKKGFKATLEPEFNYESKNN